MTTTVRPRRRWTSVRSCGGRGCGQWSCPSCRTKVLWQQDVYHKDRESKWWEWSELEIGRLRELAGTRRPEDIAGMLNAEFGMARTVQAVQQRAVRIGISLYQEGISITELRRIFATSVNLIKRRWMDTGYLVARRTTPQPVRGGKWLSDPAEVERFLRDYPWTYDAQHMLPGHPFTQLAQVIQGRDRWVTLEEAAEFLGASPSRLTVWAQRGLVPHQRRWHNGCRDGMLVVRAADLEGAREAIARAKAEGQARRNTAAIAGYRRYLEARGEAAS